MKTISLPFRLKDTSFLYLLVLFVFIFLTACNKNQDTSYSGTTYSNLNCEDTNCADYASRSLAQADFDANPECRNDLDADNDGYACEENHWTDYYSGLSNNNNNTSGSGASTDCPTTANCGCSGLNKSPCQGNSCCQWIVGTGCKCK